MNNWTSVSESLPDLNQMVLVCYPSASDGKPTYAWGARCEDAEGWAWATGGRYGIRLDKDAFWNDVEVSDDFPVTHWDAASRAAMIKEW